MPKGEPEEMLTNGAPAEAADRGHDDDARPKQLSGINCAIFYSTLAWPA